MKNADQSAFPMNPEQSAIGLSKREWMATHILAGMVANPNTDAGRGTCLRAVDLADDLLEVLALPRRKEK